MIPRVLFTIKADFLSVSLPLVSRRPQNPFGVTSAGKLLRPFCIVLLISVSKVVTLAAAPPSPAAQLLFVVLLFDMLGWPQFL